MIFYIRYNRDNGYWEVAPDFDRSKWCVIEQKMMPLDNDIVSHFIFSNFGYHIGEYSLLMAPPRENSEWNH